MAVAAGLILFDRAQPRFCTRLERPFHTLEGTSRHVGAGRGDDDAAPTGAAAARARQMLLLSGSNLSPPVVKPVDFEWERRCGAGAAPPWPLESFPVPALVGLWRWSVK